MDVMHEFVFTKSHASQRSLEIWMRNIILMVLLNCVHVFCSRRKWWPAQPVLGFDLPSVGAHGTMGIMFQTIIWICLYCCHANDWSDSNNLLNPLHLKCWFLISLGLRTWFHYTIELIIICCIKTENINLFCQITAVTSICTLISP